MLWPVQALPPPRDRRAAGAAAWRCWGVLLGLLLVNLAWGQRAWVPEVTYLGTTGAAAVAATHRLVRQWLKQQHLLPRHLLALALLSVVLLLACLPLDPLLCRVRLSACLLACWMGSDIGLCPGALATLIAPT